MSRVLTAQVGPDGVLNVSLALGAEDANRTVRITVEPVDESAAGSALPVDHESWLHFIAQTVGSITDPTFERQPQGDYEQRDPLP